MPHGGDSRPSKYDYDSIPVGYYDAVYRRNSGVQSKWHHLKFADFRKDLAGLRRHLDVGCGPGTFIGSLESEHHSTGIDIGAAQIAYAREHYGRVDRKFAVVDPGPLPFADETFDAVTVIELIEHLPPEENASLVRESLRVLRPCGKLLVSTPNYGGFWPVVEALVNRLGKISYEDQHITHYDRASLHDLLARAGGTDISVRAYMGLAPFTAVFGWRIADLVARFESEAWVNAYGLLLFATARKAR